MSETERDGVEGEGEMAPPDWCVRTTQKKKEEHEATHVPLGDWCSHCMMCRGRTHHHVTKQKSEDQSKSRRPANAMDCYFLKMNSVVKALTMSENP